MKTLPVWIHGTHTQVSRSIFTIGIPWLAKQQGNYQIKRLVEITPTTPLSTTGYVTPTHPVSLENKQQYHTACIGNLGPPGYAARALNPDPWD